jgi:hypothetical protein
MMKPEEMLERMARAASDSCSFPVYPVDIQAALRELAEKTGLNHVVSAASLNRLANTILDITELEL